MITDMDGARRDPTDPEPLLGPAPEYRAVRRSDDV
jgi:hypothetical protein